MHPLIDEIAERSQKAKAYRQNAQQIKAKIAKRGKTKQDVQ